MQHKQTLGRVTIGFDRKLHSEYALTATRSCQVHAQPAGLTTWQCNNSKHAWQWLPMPFAIVATHWQLEGFATATVAVELQQQPETRISVWYPPTWVSQADHTRHVRPPLLISQILSAHPTPGVTPPLTPCLPSQPCHECTTTTNPNILLLLRPSLPPTLSIYTNITFCLPHLKPLQPYKNQSLIPKWCMPMHQQAHQPLTPQQGPTASIKLALELQPLLIVNTRLW